MPATRCCFSVCFFWAVALAACSRHTEGFLLLLALVCVAVMLPTKSVSARVFLPAFLYALCGGCAALIPAAFTGKARAAGRAASGRRPGCLFLSPALPFSGCWANCLTEAKNAEAVRQARDTGVLYYCLDYDMSCTYSRPFSRRLFLQHLPPVRGAFCRHPLLFLRGGKAACLRQRPAHRALPPCPERGGRLGCCPCATLFSR